MVERTLIIIFFLCYFIHGQNLDWSKIHSTREFSISGVAKFQKGYLIVHDNKKKGQARISFLDSSLEIKELIWPEKKLPYDLEGIFKTFSSNYKYVVMESTGKCYTLTINPSDFRIDILNTFVLPQISGKMNLEGISIFNSNQGVVISFGDRGSNSRPSTIFTAFFNEKNNKITNINKTVFSLPRPTKFRRNIGDIAIHANGNVWVSATSDPGNNGPFSSYLYNIGNISKEGYFQMNHPDLLKPVIAIDGQKIEAMVFNENSLILMTDNENFGSTMTIFKELIRN